MTDDPVDGFRLLYKRDNRHLGIFGLGFLGSDRPNILIMIEIGLIFTEYCAVKVPFCRQKQSCKHMIPWI
jgi:hypothetical protein